MLRKYKSTSLNQEAFTLALEGVSINATASRVGLSSGRVRYALHSECEMRCPKLYSSLERRRVSPSLAELRRHSQDLGESINAPKPLRKNSPYNPVVHVAPDRQNPSILGRIFSRIFG
jgi:hypothetical protein